MNIEERIICRLCLKICDSFKAIEEKSKGILYVVLKKIDLTVIQDPMMCTYCAEMLIKCSEFKTTCLYARDYILPFINNKDDDQKLNLNDVYLVMSENGTGLSETQDICAFCMSPVKSCSAVSFDVERGDIMLQKMMEQCLPELDFRIIKKPVICAPCRDTLESCFCFMTNCSIVEEKINKYRETQDINNEGQIKLNGVLEFMSEDMTTKVEKEDAVEEEIGNVGDIVKVEQTSFGVNRCDDKDIKIKNESCTETDDYFTPKNMSACEGDIKIEKTYCVESELKKENADLVDHLNEEIDIKTEEYDFNRYENDVLPLSEVTTRSCIKQKCLLPDREKDLSKKKTNKNISITVYKCDFCSFQTKNRGNLYTHSLMHKDPSEVTMYKCDSCLFQTIRKHRLEMHLLTHKDPSEVTMYKCCLCSFQTKLKGNLKRHIMLKHKDPSEVTMYKCNLCSFQTKLKKSLKQHLLKHKDPSEVTMYECSLCSFQTKLNNSLKRHNMLKHKDSSEVTMYKCSLCSFQTKLKKSLKQHILKHKDPSEVTMYECSLCSFQTKFVSSIKRHMLKHKDH